MGGWTDRQKDRNRNVQTDRWIDRLAGTNLGD